MFIYVFKNSRHILNILIGLPYAGVLASVKTTIVGIRIFAFTVDYVISFIRKHVEKFKAELTVMQLHDSLYKISWKFAALVV